VCVYRTALLRLYSTSNPEDCAFRNWNIGLRATAPPKAISAAKWSMLDNKTPHGKKILFDILEPDLALAERGALTASIQAGPIPKPFKPRQVTSA
jgi:hypothetical protein